MEKLKNKGNLWIFEIFFWGQKKRKMENKSKDGFRSIGIFLQVPERVFPGGVTGPRIVLAVVIKAMDGRPAVG